MPFVPSLRLSNELLIGSTLTRPEDVVSWLGAVQAQEYGPARWGLGQRMTGATDAAIQEAFDDGRILRTHVLRPTWHFVAPADIRWLLTIGAPRVLQGNEYWRRKNGLTTTAVVRGVKTIARALEGRRHLTRRELADALQRAGIPVSGQALACVVMQAELEGIVCSGPRRGKQFTYALLAERVPAAPVRSLDESLAELTTRYFTSHGPATIRDFVWWSGLTVAQAKAGIALVGAVLECREIDGKACWFAAGSRARRVGSPLVHLLPIYDEFLIAFKDREWSSPTLARRPGAPAMTPNSFVHQLVIDGRVEGSWTSTVGRNGVAIDVSPFGELSSAQCKAVDAAAARYGRFLQQQVTTTMRL